MYQNTFYRWLTLGNDALQTVISRCKPDKPILYYLPALTLMIRKYPGPACMLGLGGAAVPLMLQDIPLIAVEYSEEIIEIAARYFIMNRLKNLTIIQANALNYVQECKIKFNHLLVDLYDTNHFPSECTNSIFFESCHKIITDDGFLSINLANIKEQHPLFQLIKNQFKHTLVIPIKKSANIIIIAAKNGTKESFINQLNNTLALKQLIWMESWGLVGEK